MQGFHQLNIQSYVNKTFHLDIKCPKKTVVQLSFEGSRLNVQQAVSSVALFPQVRWHPPGHHQHLRHHSRDGWACHR